MNNKFTKIVAALLVGATVLTGCAGNAGKTGTTTTQKAEVEKPVATSETKFPERSIQMVVPFGAGGGTDTWARTLADAMSQELSQPIMVSNMTGGSAGSIGVDFVWKQRHDGYTIAATSETPLLIPVQTGLKQTTKDWEYFLAGGSPAVLCVNKNSGFKTVEEIVDALKAKPKSVSIAGTQGGLWFALAQALMSYGEMDLNWIAYDGSGPAIKGAVSNEANLVIASAGEVLDFVRSGDLIPIAHVDITDWDFPEVGTIPSITKTLPNMKKVLPLKQILGMKIPKDTPAEIVAIITLAFEKAMASDKIKELAVQQAAVVYGETGEEARAIMEGMEQNLSWLLYDLEQTKFSPEEFGIARP